MFLSLAGMAWAGLLINEIAYDPPDSDGTNEWLELCNNGTETIDLTGYTVQAGGSAFGKVYTFESGTVAPGEYLLVGGASALYPNVFEGDFQNGGSETDGVRILDASGLVVDTVLYDSPNTYLLEGDGADTSVTPALDVADGSSLGRWPDCVDTNVPGTDYLEYSSPSPGVANGEPPPDDTGDTGADTGGDTGGDTGTSTTADCTGSTGITINELFTDSDAEYIELYNSGDGTVVLAGWELLFGSSSYKSPSDFPEGATLDAGDHYVIATVSADYVDWNKTIDLGNSSGAIQVRCEGVPVDTVVYGADASTWLEDATTDGSAYADGPDSPKSVSRWNDGLDTNVCSNDFTNLDATPGATNGDQCPPTCLTVGTTGLKLNEFLADADGADGGYEWVELYNAGTDPIQLDGYRIQAGTKTFGDQFAFPGCTVLDPGEFLLIGGSLVPGIDFEGEDLNFGNGTSSGDGLQVVDCEGTVLDRVFYGNGAPEADFFAEGETVESESVLIPDATYSIGRAADGEDSDVIDDWRSFASPTPGASNAVDETKDTGAGDDGGCGERSGGDRTCSTMPFALGGWELAAGLLVFLRRRR